MDLFFLLPIAMFGGFVFLVRVMVKRQLKSLGSISDSSLTPNQEAQEGMISLKRKAGKSPSQMLAVAAPAVPSALLLTCQPKTSATAGMMSFFGIKIIPSGDATFDDKYLILCNDEDIARYWFSASLRASLLTQSRLGFALWKGDTEAFVPNQTTLGEEEKALGRPLLLQFANRGREIAARWSALAAALQGQCAELATPLSPEHSEITLERRGVQLSLDTLRDERPELSSDVRLYTRLVLILTTETKPFLVTTGTPQPNPKMQDVPLEGALKERYRALAEEPSAFLSSLTTSTAELLLRADIGTIVCDNETITLYCPKIIDEPAVIESWIELLFLLRAPSEIPYR